MADITSNPFNMPLNAYAAFDAANLKNLMIQRLSQGGVFTDQIYEGSNFNTLLDIIAYSYNVLLFYLNRTANESLYNQSQLYENMNRIVKILNYNPIGNQSAVLSFKSSAPASLAPGAYTIPRYSYFTINGINYSFVEDVTFSKTTDGIEDLTQLDNTSLLYQGSFIPYPLYVANGAPFEEFSLAVLKENGENELIDHNNIHVYVLDETGKYTQWKRVNSLYLEDASSQSFECRFNENQRYSIKFGNDINGKQLKAGYVVAVYYLRSDGAQGEVGPGTLDNNSLFLFNVKSFNEIFASVKSNLNYINNSQAASLIFKNNVGSTAFSTLEDVNSIRSNAANTFKTQYRLVTTKDFEIFIKNSFSNVLTDVKVVNNWEYLAEHVRYLYNIGLKAPNADSRVLFNQVTFADSCDFNNIYVYAVPKIQTLASGKIKNNFLGTGLKDNIINSLQNIKLTTAEVVMMDPVYVAVGLGVASSEEINNQQLTPELINETKLIIGRAPDSLYSENEIKTQVSRILIDYFTPTKAKLGQTLDLSQLASDIIKIPGVTSITSSRIVNGQQINRSGLSFLVFNPVYSNSGEDINIISQSTVLPYFKMPYLYNPEKVTDSIEVVTPDIQGASLREF